MKKKERFRKNAEIFDPNFNFYYDRKLKAVVVRTGKLEMQERVVSLSAVETMVLRSAQEELSGSRKKITASDLREKIILRGCNMEMIRDILRGLVKKKILNSEKITIQNHIVEIFKRK